MGMKLNISGKLYNYLHYGVTRDTHRIDFDQVAALAREHKPKLIVAGASAYPREIPHARFAEIAEQVGAKLFVDMAHYAGLVAAGLHDNPVPVADFVTTGALFDMDLPGLTLNAHATTTGQLSDGTYLFGAAYLIQDDAGNIVRSVLSPLTTATIADKGWGKT